MIQTRGALLRALPSLPITIPCLFHYSILTAKPFSTRRRELPAKPTAHFLLHRTGAINGYIFLCLIGSITRLLRRVTKTAFIRDFPIFVVASFEKSCTIFRISRNSDAER